MKLSGEPGGYQISGMVPCRKCKAPTPLYESASDMAALFSDVLKSRNEPPLTDDELTYCEPCGQKRREHYSRETARMNERCVGWLKRIRAGASIDDIAQQTLVKHGYGEALEAALRSAGKLSNRREDDRV